MSNVRALIVHTVALQQVSSPYAKENAGRMLHKPIGLKYVQPYLSAEEFLELHAACASDRAYVWGSKRERSHQTHKVVDRKALVLFRRNDKVYKYGVVVHKSVNEALAESLWGRDVDGEMWSTIYFFAHITDKVVPATRINELLGRSPKDDWQGLVVLTMKESEQVDAFFSKHLGGL